MKNYGLFLLAFCTIVSGYTATAQKLPVKVISLVIPGEDGKNASSVVWHPTQKKYYTSMIGNSIYPMAIFDAKGKLIKSEFEAGQDLRGMWYNPLSKQIEFNCYDEGGWGHFELDKAGYITGVKIDVEGMTQPSAQSVGTYYKTGNKVLFLDEDYVAVTYGITSRENAKTLTPVYPGCSTKEEADELTPDDIIEKMEERNMSLQYTGLAKAELALLNVDQRKIELYDEKTGLLTRAISLPENIKLELSFNFCYNNGIWWFFDKESRTWLGYK